MRFEDVIKARSIYSENMINQNYILPSKLYEIIFERKIEFSPKIDIDHECFNSLKRHLSSVHNVFVYSFDEVVFAISVCTEYDETFYFLNSYPIKNIQKWIKSVTFERKIGINFVSKDTIIEGI